MDIREKLSAGMSKVSKGLKDSSENLKLEGKIAEQKKAIKGLTREISELVIEGLDAGEVMNPAIMERYESILVARSVIEELEKEKKTSKVICPNCGAKSPKEMNYCGRCGGKLQNEVEEDCFEEEDVEVVEGEIVENEVVDCGCECEGCEEECVKQESEEEKTEE